ncbi:hypothetical protein FisN_2Lh536 [Fistulifera solaris]|uniref:NB-ARC domain-containing protein n=1 Tax=Fistulifera solaris TaxID=1519565 RepID=A0A1Z5JAI9_FISSO|nr:hypothetical protein FisN_2Lh536 [Fistulifera solaris]|eukprot:GAX11007.1 hypothetical protein FisN_2Lh536 [Fistulifera solaris]
MLVAVTSCRSDGYYNDKAPGSTSKLPRKAPTNLKLFHELAVGVKDAYVAVGARPQKPSDSDKTTMDSREFEARLILWNFVGNLDFLLALVDEVSVDTVTRGALKDDATFKGLRDVIKKGNRVLETMLVRRERKYTLFFRLAQPFDTDLIDRIGAWNAKVEKAVGQVTDIPRESGTEDSSDTSANTMGSPSGSVSSRVGVFSRGRQLIPTAGRVRSRRATPTPRLRKHFKDGEGDADHDAGEDGFSSGSASPSPSSRHHDDTDLLPSGLMRGPSHNPLKEIQPVEAKDELVDVIRGLRVEKLKSHDANADADLAALKPSWRPKADIPSAVPKLPLEYVHRHRLMKQVVGCLLDESDFQENENGQIMNTAITCVTSRHGDKAGNGKSILAVAVIQTVEVRERFSDGIAWLKLGPAPLGDRDVRRLYEDLYRQIIAKEEDLDASVTDPISEGKMEDSFSSVLSESRIDRMVDRADSSRRFAGGDLEGIKEDLARMIVRRNILICLDDVWRVEDAKWFIFETPTYAVPPRDSPYKILITTRMPALLGSGTVQEVFVRIFSEHEAVKLLLSTAGRRPYGGRSSAVFNQSKMIVKGCGNSPLGILLIGSMLRHWSRNWNLNSPVWMGVYNQCSLNLEEAANLRSFKNAFLRIVDLSFFTIDDSYVRIGLRRCFVLFAMAFRSNDWVLSGRGIPHSVLIKFFGTVIECGVVGGKKLDPKKVVKDLESLKLISRAMHAVTRTTSKGGQDSFSATDSQANIDISEKSEEEGDWDDFEDMPTRKIQHFYTMHDSLKTVAEQMAEREMPCFTPEADTYTYFAEAVADEKVIAKENMTPIELPLRFIFNTPSRDKEQDTMYLTDEFTHELVAITLLGGGDGRSLMKRNLKEVLQANQLSMQLIEGGDKFEEYTTSFLPEHLMFANAHTTAAELLTNPDFVRRRVFGLGIMESTGRQVADILDGRNFSAKAAKNKRLLWAKDDDAPPSPSKLSKVPLSPPRSPGKLSKVPLSPPRSPGKESKPSDGAAASTSPFESDTIVCEAGRMIIEEVHKATNSMGSSDSLGMATCLVTVGETLLRCRQPRDAMLRLEEGVSIFRGLLGPYHVYVAHALHSVAKALVKLGETRVALLKFAEAARIYETCNATLHYDSIANAQSLASLLVDIGDVRKAEAMFEEVIAMKRSVYGENSVPVAKTINSYAILLAKHGRMNDALRQYEVARDTYLKSPPSLIIDPEFEAKCSYDMTLITLNIASIYSKKNDLHRALQSYEEGVKGLAEYDEAMEKIREINGSVLTAAKHSSHKHVIAALGRIGSLKIKLGDQEGALEAYLYLIDQVDDDSPIASHIEKAKAHIKCATMFRKREGAENQETAISHLKEAHRMYKALYASGHKDTVAIQTTIKQWLAEDKEKETK